MSDVIGRGTIELVVDARQLEAGISDAERDLLERIARARECLAKADRAESEAAKMVADLEENALTSRPGRAKRLCEKAARIRRTIWKDVGDVRASAVAVLNQLHAELYVLTGEERTL